MPEWKPGYRHSIADGIQGLGLTVGLAWLFYDSFYAVLFLSPIIWFWHRERMAERKRKETEQFQRMFREWILLLASSLSAGYSVENALRQSYRELQMMFPKGGYMLDELKEMLMKSENNLRPEVLLMELAQHYPLEEVKSFSEVFCTARASGGSLNAVIRSTASQMAEVMDTKREIRTMLAAKVYEQKIMTVMPAAVLVYVRICSSEFLEGLYHNLAGILVMTICLCIYAGAYLLGKRMVQFEI